MAKKIKQCKYLFYYIMLFVAFPSPCGIKYCTLIRHLLREVGVRVTGKRVNHYSLILINIYSALVMLPYEYDFSKIL